MLRLNITGRIGASKIRAIPNHIGMIYIFFFQVIVYATNTVECELGSTKGRGLWKCVKFTHSGDGKCYER